MDRRSLRAWGAHLEEVVGVDEAEDIIDVFEKHVTRDDLDHALAAQSAHLDQALAEQSDRFLSHLESNERQFRTQLESIERQFRTQLESTEHRLSAQFERRITDAVSTQARTLVLSQLAALVTIAALAFGLR